MPGQPLLEAPGRTVPCAGGGKQCADALSGAASGILFPCPEDCVGSFRRFEHEIAKAIVFLHSNHHQVVEGAGSIGVAALMARRIVTSGRKTGIVISGGNISDRTILKAYKEAGDFK